MLTTRWADDLVRRADELDPHERDKAQFYLRQVTAALSPSNFIGTNPELLRATLGRERREPRARPEDAGRGHRGRQGQPAHPPVGRARVQARRQSRHDAGQGDLPQRAHRAHPVRADDAEVYKRPLLIVPPWINKFYILDLNPEKSFIRWAVAQGLTVFVISWINPDERHADKGFEAYMREGVLTALDCDREGDRRARRHGDRLLRRRHAARRDARLHGGGRRQAHRQRHLLHRAGRLHRRRRPQGLRRRGAAEGGRGEDGRARLSRRLGHGQRLQHAAAERPHLVLLRQQLPQGQRADALRPPGVELRLDAHARRQPQVLPAPLLFPERPVERAHGARRQDDRPRRR